MEAFNTSSSSSSMAALPFSYTFTSSSSSSGGGSGATTATSNNVFNYPMVVTTTKAPWMDSRIWSKLPQRLLDRVLVFLPPPAFFRARAVCKRWYSLLFSNAFLQLYFHVSPRHHWFLFFNPKTPPSIKTASYNIRASSASAAATCEGYLLDPHELSWYRIPFTLIPPGFSPASSSGGLLCFVSDQAGPKSLILCNPISGSLSPLPSPTLRPRLFPSIGLNVTPTSVDVTVAGDDLISPYAVKNLSSESFHIDAGGFYSLWGTTSSLPRLCSLESGRMVQVSGKFYCMNYSPFSVLSYDVSVNAWSNIQAPMRRFLRSPSLLESGGKLILVAAVEKSKLNVPRSLRVWSLQACGAAWAEIERMPQQLYVQFAEMEAGNGFDVVGHGEFVAIVIRGGSSGNNNNNNKALLFDLLTKRWQWVPQCPYVRSGCGYGDQVGELHGFAYDPRLATPVTALLDQLTLPFQSFTA